MDSTSRNWVKFSIFSFLDMESIFALIYKRSTKCQKSKFAYHKFYFIWFKVSVSSGILKSNFGIWHLVSCTFKSCMFCIVLVLLYSASQIWAKKGGKSGFKPHKVCKCFDFSALTTILEASLIKSSAWHNVILAKKESWRSRNKRVFC